jgi:PKD repeat protein
VSRTAIEASTTLIKVSIPLSQLSTIASQLGGISFIRPPYTPYTLAITGEGIAAIGADAFHVAGITGSGVKVAIIDLGFAGLSQAQGRGDIPYSVQQHDLTGTGLTSGITHGTAIAEIVHGWYNTNFYDGIGTIAEIAKRSVAGGILWLNAAGNEAQSHWEGTFSDNNSDTWNDQSLTFSATSGSQVILYMTWDDWPQASNDYDLYLYDPSSNLVASSTKHQTGTEEPTESIMTTVSASGTYTVRVKGAGSKKIEIYNLYQYLAPAIAASSILAPGNVAEVVTVGAIDHAHYASGPLEPYSSQGPTNDGRTGIDLCAPDNVTTGTSPYTSFAGTSGATPHATGAAALLLAQDPSLSESALRARLLSQTVAMGSSYLYGHGRLVLSPPSAANQPPIAAFNANPSSTTVGSQVAFNGSASSDVDGTIVSYAWQYGDGITGFGVTVQHAYAAVGTYTVRLTVTDDDGATDMTTQQVVIASQPNQPPTAAFNANPSSTIVGSSVAFNGSASSDPDGSIVSYAWQYGDGTTGFGVTVQHAYAAVGTYTVRLTVTDDDGATGTTTQQVVIAAQPNQPPTAAFNASPSSTTVGSPVTFNGSTSSDPDGSIVSYTWNFGDGMPGSGVTAQHAYAAVGTYTVRLTVTDNNGATGTTTQQVVISTQPNQPPTAAFNANPSATTVGSAILFNGSASSDPDGWIVSYAWQYGDVATGSGATVQHAYATAGTYTVRLTVTDNDGATGTTTRQVVISAQPNQPPTAAFNSSPSSTTVGSAISFNGSASSDPDGWIVSYTWQYGDGATGSGAAVQHAYAAAGTYTVRLTVTDNGGATGTTTRQVVISAQPNQPPTAAFNSSPSSTTVGSSILFNGSASSDPDGWIVSYAWNFGDGTTGSGVSAQHAYAVAGTYTVRLTVTDDDGATGTITHQVLIEAGTPPTGDGEWVSPSGYSDPDEFYYSEAKAFDDDTNTKAGTVRGAPKFTWTTLIHFTLPAPRECSKVRFMVSDDYAAWAYGTIRVEDNRLRRCRFRGQLEDGLFQRWDGQRDENPRQA